MLLTLFVDVPPAPLPPGPLAEVVLLLEELAEVGEEALETTAEPEVVLLAVEAPVPVITDAPSLVGED